MDSKFYYTVPHIASILQLPVSTAYQLVKKMTHNKIGRRIVVEERDFHRYLDQTKVVPKVTRQARF